MRCLTFFLLLIAVMPPAWAADEITVIYRKADRLVAGIVKPPQTVDVELKNITGSELGGRPDDYEAVAVPESEWAKRGDRDVAVSPSKRVVFVSNTKREGKRAANQSARTKLKSLGLTEEELDAVLEP